ncbi:MAG: type I glyceraldehyde-3-phosphate dehydrogenase [Saprospiraceae bacterium]|nr:type I glyceraldehyde-3-phosphate dehydrogenase [Saprospiraceae bacterium]
MPKRIAINGFGRIGRLTFRNLIENPEVEVVAINDLTDNETLAHLLKYDTAHGPFKGTVSATDEHLIVNGKHILASAIKDPTTLPWKENNIDVVLECTGIFTSAEKAGKHLEAGAKKVVISAPAKGDIKTIVLGVNDDEIADGITIYSNASCTTNCLTPVVKVVMDNWGLQFGSMSTIHAYTGDQNIQDGPHRDLRRARAAAQNIVPTSTGAANAVSEVIPAVKGKFFAIALRVPVITGSMIECNFMLEKNVTVEEVNAAFKKAATAGPLQGILQYTEDPIVSSDIIGNKHSSIFDSGLTDVKNGNFVKLVSWYDNEAGYSARLAELTARV